MTAQSKRVIALTLMVTVISACEGSSGEDDVARYCDLIDETVAQTIVGKQKVKGYGAPRRDEPNTVRHLDCRVITTGAGRATSVLTADSFEMGEATRAREEQEIANRIDQLKSSKSAEFEEYAAEDGSIGYSYYSDGAAFTRILTDTQRIDVRAEATEDQAAEFVPATREVAQNFNENLVEWDQENPPADE